jgi:hypothetical protein
VELLSGRVVHPEEGLLLEAVLIPCHEDIISHSCPSFILRWLQGVCRENGSEQRQTQHEKQMPCFLLIHGPFIKVILSTSYIISVFISNNLL